MADLFTGPSAGSEVKITDFVEHLLLVTPTEYRTEVPTVYGIKDAVVADIVVLDADGGPQSHASLYLFQGRLIGQTKTKVGSGMILGRLGRDSTPKPGQEAAFSLSEPTEEDKQLARDYLAKQADPFA